MSLLMKKVQIVVYLHTQLQGFFANVSLNFFNVSFLEAQNHLQIDESPISLNLSDNRPESFYNLSTKELL